MDSYDCPIFDNHEVPIVDNHEVPILDNHDFLISDNHKFRILGNHNFLRLAADGRSGRQGGGATADSLMPCELYHPGEGISLIDLS